MQAVEKYAMRFEAGGILDTLNAMQKQYNNQSKVAAAPITVSKHLKSPLFEAQMNAGCLTNL